EFHLSSHVIEANFASDVDNEAKFASQATSEAKFASEELYINELLARPLLTLALLSSLSINFPPQHKMFAHAHKSQAAPTTLYTLNTYSMKISLGNFILFI